MTKNLPRVTQFLNKLEILPLPCIFINECVCLIEISCFIRKFLHISNLNDDIHEYSNQSKDKPRIPLLKTTNLKNSPHYSRVQSYQSIVDTILIDDNFKSKLKNSIFETLYYY